MMEHTNIEVREKIYDVHESKDVLKRLCFLEGEFLNS